MPPSAASRSSAAIAAGAMHRCLWLQHKPLGAAQRGGHRRWLLHSTGAHIAFGGLAQLSGHRRLRCILLPFWLRCTPPCGITAAAATNALAPVLPHSTEARVASLVLGCCALSPWEHRLPRRHRRSRTTLLHSAVVHATLGGLPWRSDPAACAHTAALGCGARRPATLPSIAALLLVPMLLPSAAVRAALGGVTPRGSPAACAHAAAPSCGARCPRRHHPAWRPCRSRPTLLHSAVRPLSCVVTRAIRSVGAPGTCGSPREARAASAPRVHCAVRPVAARSLVPRARLAPRGPATRRAKRASLQPPVCIVPCGQDKWLRGHLSRGLGWRPGDMECTRPEEKPAASRPQQCSPMLLSPSAMHTPHECHSHQRRQPHTRSRRPAARSAAAQCCRRRVECDARPARAYARSA